MNVVVLYDDKGTWVPAHPGCIAEEDVAYELIHHLQADGYRVSVLPAIMSDQPLERYREYQGGEDDGGLFTE